MNPETLQEILQKLYDQFHADVIHELAMAAPCPGETTMSVAVVGHYARANAYTNARDAVMRAARWSLTPAEETTP